MAKYKYLDLSGTLGCAILAMTWQTTFIMGFKKFVQIISSSHFVPNFERCEKPQTADLIKKLKQKTSQRSFRN